METRQTHVNNNNFITPNKLFGRHKLIGKNKDSITPQERNTKGNARRAALVFNANLFIMHFFFKIIDISVIPFCRRLYFAVIPAIEKVDRKKSKLLSYTAADCMTTQLVWCTPTHTKCLSNYSEKAQNILSGWHTNQLTQVVYILLAMKFTMAH